MKIWSKFPIIVGFSWVLANLWAGPAPPSGAAAAIQAIQQAPDPSAVVAAYANGVASDRNDSKLNSAYVARMVDLGLPELAYHQAEFLTSLQSNDGLAWGVVAYVHARRGEMEEAISAINLAGQFAPDNIFVQRTAGEIVAWYDTKADKAKLPDNAKNGLAQIRSSMEHQTAFATAYDTAKSAYQAQSKATSTSQEPAASAEPGQYAPTPQTQTQTQGDQVGPMGYAVAAPPPPVYYPQYYYDWGPNWVEPAPWWWWQPVGFFGGFSFFPFSTVLVFDHHDSFHHNHSSAHAHDGFAHNHGFSHEQSFHHDGMNVAFHDSNRAFFHQDGKTSFFGTAAQANGSMAQFHTANGAPDPASSSIHMHGTRSSASLPGTTTASTGLSGTRSPWSAATASTALRGSRSSFVVDPPRVATTVPNRATISRSSTLTPSVAARNQLTPTSRFGSGTPSAALPAPAFRSSMPRQNFRMPAQSFAPARNFSAPRMAAPPSMPQQRMAPAPMPSANRGFVGGGGFRGGGGGGGNRR